MPLVFYVSVYIDEINILYLYSIAIVSNPELFNPLQCNARTHMPVLCSDSVVTYRICSVENTVVLRSDTAVYMVVMCSNQEGLLADVEELSIFE